ncbi:MAG: hypothetical protein RIC03_12460 [Cyclobacteriaceae bacterium]
MNASELLKPRFEIIADFPNNHFGKIGTILDRDWAEYPNDDETQEAIWRISYFPHLFRQLNWWENRSIEDMPKRVISKALKNDSEVIDIQEWDMELMVGWIDKEQRICCSLLSFKPEYGYFPVD